MTSLTAFPYISADGKPFVCVSFQLFINKFQRQQTTSVLCALERKELPVTAIPLAESFLDSCAGMVTSS